MRLIREDGSGNMSMEEFNWAYATLQQEVEERLAHPCSTYLSQLENLKDLVSFRHIIFLQGRSGDQDPGRCCAAMASVGCNISSALQAKFRGNQARAEVEGMKKTKAWLAGKRCAETATASTI